MDTLTQRYPLLFFVQGSTTSFASSAANVLKKLKEEGKIGNKVAIVNVADAFGIELANAGRPIFTQAGFDIVYDKSYPLGTQDLSPVMKAAKAANPDAFVAWSYPPDTFGLAEQAKIEGLNVKAYYSAVAVAFPAFRGKFGASCENILGAGGIQDGPEIRDYYKRHKEVTNVDADYWGSPLYYTFLQILTQAFEGVGSVDRAAVVEHLKKNKFKTIIGEVDIRNQKLDRYWTVGQWQDGFFHAVAGVGFSDYKPVRLKTGWA
jgi:branched-chain amino acid transport system substrate-binding protein